jgi:hypothetical protein
MLTLTLFFRECERLCTRWLRSGRPSPFDTVLSLHRYAATVSISGGEGVTTVVWNEDHQSMTVRGQLVKLEDIPALYHGTLESIKEKMKSLSEGVDLSIPFDYTKITDDPQNGQPGYGFLSDPNILRIKNDLLISLGKPDWFVAGLDGRLEWNRSKLAGWMETAQELNKLFLVATHMGGGQPARGTEILSMLVRNRQNGERSLFALPGGLASVIGYNKVSRRIGSDGDGTH